MIQLENGKFASPSRWHKLDNDVQLALTRLIDHIASMPNVYTHDGISQNDFLYYEVLAGKTSGRYRLSLQSPIDRGK
jgi:hypothetical protein